VGSPQGLARTNSGRVQALANSGSRGSSLLWPAAIAALLVAGAPTLYFAAPRRPGSGSGNASNNTANAEVTALSPAERLAADMRKRLQGDWLITRMNHFDGGEIVFVDQVVVTFERDRFTMPGDGDFHGTFRLDAEKDPIRIDWALDNKAVLHGIIKFQGDTLAMSFSEERVGNVYRPLPDPPADFQTGPQRWLMEFSPHKP
jgi:uncharacterized protein (TIGR03067 family)